MTAERVQDERQPLLLSDQLRRRRRDRPPRLAERRQGARRASQRHPRTPAPPAGRRVSPARPTRGTRFSSWRRSDYSSGRSATSSSAISKARCARVGELGYDGVELFQLHGHAPEQVRRGSTPRASSPPGGTRRSTRWRTTCPRSPRSCATLGTDRLAIAWIDPERGRPRPTSSSRASSPRGAAARDEGLRFGVPQPLERGGAARGRCDVPRPAARAAEPELALARARPRLGLARRRPTRRRARRDAAGAARSCTSRTIASREGRDDVPIGDGVVGYDARRSRRPSQPGAEWLIVEQDEVGPDPVRRGRALARRGQEDRRWLTPCASASSAAASSAARYVENAPAFDALRLVACADLDTRSRPTRSRDEHGLRALDGRRADRRPTSRRRPQPHAAARARRGHRARRSRRASTSTPRSRSRRRSRPARGSSTQAERRGLRLGCAPDTFLGAAYQTARAADRRAAPSASRSRASATMLAGGPESWHPNADIFYRDGGGPAARHRARTT